MFAKVEKDNDGRITHAYYVFDNNANPDLFPGVLVNDGVVDNEIRNNPATVIDNYHYDKDTGFVDPRPANPAVIDKVTITANGVDSCIISNIPDNSEITVDGTSYPITANVFEFTVTFSGLYVITVELFPYLTKTFEVIAQ